jgi:hypothetical protein
MVGGPQISTFPLRDNLGGILPVTASFFEIIACERG